MVVIEYKVIFDSYGNILSVPVEKPVSEIVLEFTGKLCCIRILRQGGIIIVERVFNKSALVIPCPDFLTASRIYLKMVRAVLLLQI